MAPRVSVLMTIFNPGRFLKPAVDSLLSQTLDDFELVAVENGSSDGSKDVMRSFAAADARIRVIDLPKNIGPAPALNRALHEARGDYLAVLDSDDLADPERLAQQTAFLDSRPDVALVGSHAHFINETSAVIGSFSPSTDPSALRDRLAYDNPIAHSSSMFRRAAALGVGGYPPKITFAYDLALWLRFAESGGGIAMIGKPLASIRHHVAQTTLAPTYVFTRYLEPLDLYRRALALPGLSDEARRRGRANLASIRYALAGALWRARRPWDAALELGKAIGIAPLHCLSRAASRMRAGPRGS